MDYSQDMQKKESRDHLMGRLRDIDSSDELFLMCVDQACEKLKRYAEMDRAWLEKWIPILMRQAG